MFRKVQQKRPQFFVVKAILKSEGVSIPENREKKDMSTKSGFGSTEGLEGENDPK